MNPCSVGASPVGRSLLGRSPCGAAGSDHAAARVVQSDRRGCAAHKLGEVGIVESPCVGRAPRRANIVPIPPIRGACGGGRGSIRAIEDQESPVDHGGQTVFKNIWGRKDNRTAPIETAQQLQLKPGARAPGARHASSERHRGESAQPQPPAITNMTTAEVAQRLIQLAAAAEDSSTDEQRLGLNVDYLDMCLSRDRPVEKRIRPFVEIRGIGHQLNRAGGSDLLRTVEDEIRRGDEVVVAAEQPVQVHRLDAGEGTHEQRCQASFSATLGLLTGLWDKLGRTPQLAAREITQLAEISAAHFDEVIDDRKPLLWNAAYLDELLASGESVEAALVARARIRGIGYRLSCAGGLDLMRAVYDVLRAEDRPNAASAGSRAAMVGLVWGGGGKPIGDWTM